MNTLSINNPKFSITTTGIEFHQDLDFDEWNDLGQKLAPTRHSRSPTPHPSSRSHSKLASWAASLIQFSAAFSPPETTPTTPRSKCSATATWQGGSGRYE